MAELANADADVHLQERIGPLLPGREDHWWAVTAATDTAVLGNELRRVLEEVAIPWLDARRSLDDLMTLARTTPDDFPGHMLGRFKMLLADAGLDRLASEVPL